MQRPHPRRARASRLAPVLSVARFALFVLLAAPAGFAQDGPQVVAQLERAQIYEGESVVYRVSIENTENPSAPDLSAFSDFVVEPAGDKSLNSRSVTIVNGRVAESVRFGREFYFRLTPKAAGLLQVPPPLATIDGQVVKGRAFTLKVVPPQDQDLALLDLSTDREAVYPLQPFTLTLRILVKDLPDSHADRDPVSVQSAPPALHVPWVDPVPDGLEPTSDWQHWLGAYQSRGDAGFSVNELGSNQLLSFFENRATAFHPKPRRLRRPTRNGQEAGYWEYSFPRVFLGKKTGEYAFGPVTLKGTFGREIDRRGRLAGEEVYAVAKRLTVTVKDVPREGRPPTYTGAIGRFDWGAELSPRRARVGDPLTLTLTLKGQGTLGEVSAPDLKSMPDVADGFRVYEATEESKGGARCFTYSLRPLKAEVKAFPAVPLSYFDVEKERFVTVSTPPLPVEVSPSERMMDGEVVARPREAGPVRKEIEARKEGIFANVNDLDAVRDESVRPGPRIAVVAGFFFAYLAALVVARRLRRWAGDPALRRRRAAAGRARARLRDARARVEANALREGTQELRGALVGLVADVADVPEAGLTTRDVGARLAAWSVAEDVARRTGAFLDACDGARYGAGDAVARGLTDEAESLLDALLRTLDASGRLR
ncbi:MAG: BatD family protein [Planctomycetes bacterium]|nr:BatD family protein [Planctomycetota bacterium]